MAQLILFVVHRIVSSRVHILSTTSWKQCASNSYLINAQLILFVVHRIVSSRVHILSTVLYDEELQLGGGQHSYYVVDGRH